MVAFYPINEYSLTTLSMIACKPELNLVPGPIPSFYPPPSSRRGMARKLDQHDWRDECCVAGGHARTRPIASGGMPSYYWKKMRSSLFVTHVPKALS